MGRNRRIQLEREKNDPTPMAKPIGYNQPLSLQDEIRRFIRQEVSVQAQDDGHETFEEADDFEEEDPDTVDLTNYELTALQALENAEEINLDAPDDPSPAEPAETKQENPSEAPLQSDQDEAPQEKTI